MSPVRAYIGLGSNLDDPVFQIRQALEALAALPDCRWVAGSPLYRTAPLGGPPGQPDYINAVAALDTVLTPDTLLAVLQDLETAHGRIRTERWGPRTLDLDLLLYGQQVSADPRLTLPHPRLDQRAFVLYPLYDLAPDLILPGHGPLSELLARCPFQALTRLDSTD